MKTTRFVRTFGSWAVAAGVCTSVGCNPSAALFLQDYGRDLLLGGGALLAALAALGQSGEALQQANNANDTAQEALEAAQGAQGQPGPPGADGQDGADGQVGPDGQDGADGQQGPPGADGQDGQDGQDGLDGAPGPEFFSVFVDQFFRPPTNIEEGGGIGGTIEDAPSFGAPVGWRVGISNRYQAGNPITMRLYIDVDYLLDQGRPTNCEQFRIAMVRMRNGAPVDTYGTERFILVDIPDNQGETFVVVDLPINTPDGLNLPNDLGAGHMLGVGMEWSDPECPNLGRAYRMFGVEFFESAIGGTSVSGATISETLPGCTCGGGGD